MVLKEFIFDANSSKSLLKTGTQLKLTKKYISMKDK